MKAFGNDSRADMDMAVFVARNSVCDLIGEITRVKNSNPDQNAFIYLSNEKLHEIENIFNSTDDSGKTIKESTIGGKKIFLEAAVAEFIAQLQEDNEINKTIKSKYQDLLKNNYNSPDGHAELNRDINALQTAIEDYRKAVVLELAKKQAKILGENVAKEFNDTKGDDNDEQTRLRLSAIEYNMNKLWGGKDAGQQEINEAFLKAFKSFNTDNTDNKELTAYVPNVQNDDELKEYKNNKAHLTKLAEKAYAQHVASLKEQDNTKRAEAATKIQALFRGHQGRLKAQEAKQNKIIEELKQLIAEAEKTKNSQLLDDKKATLNQQLADLPAEMLKNIRRSIVEDNTSSEALTCLQFNFPSEEDFTKSSQTAIGTPADIQKCCEDRLNAAEAKQALFINNFSELSNQYKAATQDTSKIDQTLIKAVNDFPHAIANIFGELRKSTTGSSRFF